jgi:hypothetical protein
VEAAMKGTVKDPPVLEADQRTPDARVLREHIAILREIRAPEDLIAIAERVAAEVATKK